MIGHRPLHPDSESSLKMARQRDQLLERLKEKYPHLSWESSENEAFIS